MNRFSGVAIFSSAYALCIVAIICCLHIKNDTHRLQEDILVSPRIQSLESHVVKPIHYVLMNPIKSDLPIELNRQRGEANILVATLPAPEWIAGSGSSSGAEFNPDPFLDKLGDAGLPWQEVFDVDLEV